MIVLVLRLLEKKSEPALENIFNNLIHCLKFVSVPLSGQAT